MGQYFKLPYAPENEGREYGEETLRAILQESEAKLEMKIFNPPSFFVWR